MVLLPGDFESPASTNFTTPAVTICFRPTEVRLTGHTKVYRRSSQVNTLLINVRTRSEVDPLIGRVRFGWAIAHLVIAAAARGMEMAGRGRLVAGNEYFTSHVKASVGRNLT